MRVKRWRLRQNGIRTPFRSACCARLDETQLSSESRGKDGDIRTLARRIYWGGVTVVGWIGEGRNVGGYE